jgi:hypothetical protein
MARPFLVPFRRLLQLAGSRWRYSTPPPHGLCTVIKCSHVVPFGKQGKLETFKSETLSLDLMCKGCKGFLRRLFRPSTSFVHFIFSEYPAFCTAFFFVQGLCLSKLIYNSINSFFFLLGTVKQGEIPVPN